MICGVEGCNERSLAYGYCSSHGHRFKRYGSPLAGGPFRMPKGTVRLCAVEGCLKPHLAKDFCKPHYRLFVEKRTQRVKPEKIIQTCRKEACELPVTARGLCRKHVKALYRQEAKRLKPPKPVKPVKTCSVPECTRQQKGWGYCAAHYRRWRHKGDPGPADIKDAVHNAFRCEVESCSKFGLGAPLCEDHYLSGFKIGVESVALRYRAGSVGADGYVSVYAAHSPLASKNGRIQEHRLVMSLVTGRCLAKYETVHHKNGVRSDNRPENLELWVRSQPAGQRVEDVVGWAKEVLERYAPQSLKGN